MRNIILFDYKTLDFSCLNEGNQPNTIELKFNSSSNTIVYLTKDGNITKLAKEFTDGYLSVVIPSDYYYSQTGEFKVNIVDGNYTSEYINFSINEILTTDCDLIVKHESSFFNIKSLKKTISENAIQQYATHYEFPNRGSENVLYIGLEEKKTWCWVNGGYVLLNDGTADLEIDIIEGGNANG